MEPVAVCRTSNQHPDRSCTTKWKSWSTMAPSWRDRCWFDCVTALCLQDTPSAVTPQNGPPYSDERCRSQSLSQVNHSIDPVPGHHRWSWCGHQTAWQSMPEASGHSKHPMQRVTDLEAAIRQLRQINCILDSCTISASYEVSEAQKALLLLPHTAKGASTSSEELNAQISPRTDDEHNLPYDEDYLQEH